ncbi:MAG: hypothetical protein KGI98_17315 [Euryarchaeota archaeon]|nr:hypothetical protein [Euryarchaeota archaeon]MDE2046668.1 hypothetical protein [Thermoplasmata archaeon]
MRKNRRSTRWDRKDSYIFSTVFLHSGFSERGRVNLSNPGSEARLESWTRSEPQKPEDLSVYFEDRPEPAGWKLRELQLPKAGMVPDLLYGVSKARPKRPLKDVGEDLLEDFPDLQVELQILFVCRRAKDQPMDHAQ